MKLGLQAAIFLAVVTLSASGKAYQTPTVYFDHGSAIVSDEQRRGIIREIANRWSKVPNVCQPAIGIVGHLDGAESAARADTDLDGRRALAVYKALQEEGWTHGNVMIVKRGFTQPHLQTTDSEPQNRRVELFPRSTTKAGVRECSTAVYGGCWRTLDDGTQCPLGTFER